MSRSLIQDGSTFLEAFGPGESSLQWRGCLVDGTQPVLGGTQLGPDNLGQGCWKRDSSFGHEEGVGCEQMTSAVPPSPEFLGREKQPQNSEQRTRLLRTEQRSRYSWREEGGSARGESRSPNK